MLPTKAYETNTQWRPSTPHAPTAFPLSLQEDPISLEPQSAIGRSWLAEVGPLHVCTTATTDAAAARAAAAASTPATVAG